MTSTSPKVLLTALLATGLLSAGCGGDDEEPVTAGAQAAATPGPKPAAAEAPAAKPSTVLEVAALPSGRKPYRFDLPKGRLEARAGLLEIRFTNGDVLPSGTWFPHNVRINKGATCCDPANDVGGTDSLDGGASAVGRVELAPGRYWLICSIGGHFDGDLGKMKHRLVVS